MPANLSPTSSAPAPTPFASANARHAQVTVPYQPASSPTAIAITLTQAPQPSVNPLQNGTVLVAFFALVGVLITVWSAHRRMRRELLSSALNARAERNHSRLEADRDRTEAAREAHRERIATTRRQVYLEAAESLGKAQHFLASLAGQDLTSLDYASHLGPFVVAVNKIAIVGEMETVRVSRELSTAINRAFMQALGDLLPLAQHNNELAYHSGQLADAQREVNRVLAAQQSYNESQSRDQGAFEALNASFRFHQDRATAQAAEVQLRYSRIAVARQQYSAFMLENAREFNSLIDQLADSVRREMGLQTSLDVFTAQTMAMWDAAKNAHAQLTAKIAEFQQAASREAPTSSSHEGAR